MRPAPGSRSRRSSASWHRPSRCGSSRTKLPTFLKCRSPLCSIRPITAVPSGSSTNAAGSSLCCPTRGATFGGQRRACLSIWPRCSPAENADAAGVFDDCGAAVAADCPLSGGGCRLGRRPRPPAAVLGRHSVAVAGRGRDGIAGHRADRRHRRVWPAPGGGLCRAPLCERAHHPRAFRTAAAAMTELPPAAWIAPPAWINEPATRAVLEALAAGGVEARFVGGVVRDLLLGLPQTGPGGIKVGPTGRAHGTVTAVVASPGGAPPRHFEITTLRRDVETFGRRARVAFDAGWAEDAARRDFTINAIFLAPDGALYDPTGGLVDLAQRRVRFVGDPQTRIREDVLRILRYYRFEARFGRGAGDAAARAACRALAHLLPTLSPERVLAELTRLLATAAPGGALRMMAEDGVLAVILPEARRLERLERLVAIEPGPDPLRRLAALIETDAAGALALAERLRFSNAWRDRLAGLVPPWPLDPAADDVRQRRALYRLGAARFADLVLLAGAEGRIAQKRLRGLLALARDWQPPRFPLNGRDVRALGIAPGPQVGALLKAVEEWWEEADFAPDRGQCLERLKAAAAQPQSAPDPRALPRG